MTFASFTETASCEFQVNYNAERCALEQAVRNIQMNHTIDIELLAEAEAAIQRHKDSFTSRRSIFISSKLSIELETKMQSILSNCTCLQDFQDLYNKISDIESENRTEDKSEATLIELEGHSDEVISVNGDGDDDDDGGGEGDGDGDGENEDDGYSILSELLSSDTFRGKLLSGVKENDDMLIESCDALYALQKIVAVFGIDDETFVQCLQDARVASLKMYGLLWGKCSFTISDILCEIFAPVRELPKAESKGEGESESDCERIIRNVDEALVYDLLDILDPNVFIEVRNHYFVKTILFFN